jgi:regulator of protease activity HflC (stomatin/prohibitin superfamily)
MHDNWFIIRVIRLLEIPILLFRKICLACSRHTRRNIQRYVVVLLLTIFLLVYFWRNIFITIHAGEAGVLYLRFWGGTVIERAYGEGFHIIAPWDVMTVYNVRYQTVPHQMETLTRRGLKIKVNLSIRYRPEVKVLGVLHAKIGPDYLKKIIIPEVEAKIRAVMSKYEAREIYASKKELIVELVKESMEEISQRFVDIDNVMLTRIGLPEQIATAMESKLEHQQLAEAYVFKLDREEKEAQRKKIEAEGIKTYYTIVSSALNEQLLRWKGIDVTTELAKSPNTKILINGSGKYGLSVIMDAKK